MNKQNTSGMYLHIPFCVKKCNYCDFLSFSSNEETKSLYVDALIKEIIANSYTNKSISTIFFGGGTPSILDSKHIYNILNCISKYYEVDKNAEITIEANPGTTNLMKLSDYKHSGINRLSIGLQSANDHELLKLSRIHSYSQFLESYKDARDLGFDNINVDLMSALPTQTLKSFEASLRKVIALAPEHISAYSLILEENTPLFDYIKDGNMDLLPNEDDERAMYYLTDELLKEYGYYRYEISNYSKPGYECRHNLSYWERANYFGFGLGASSFINGIRYKNTSSMERYLQKSSTPTEIVEDKEILSRKDAMEEYMFLGLRKTSGISITTFKNEFCHSIYDIYGDILKKFTQEGLITTKDDNILLTTKGLDVSNYIFSEFILDEEETCNQ